MNAVIAARQRYHSVGTALFMNRLCWMSAHFVAGDVFELFEFGGTNFRFCSDALPNVVLFEPVLPDDIPGAPLFIFAANVLVRDIVMERRSIRFLLRARVLAFLAWLRLSSA